MKRIAIFIDGTWNRPDAENSTNVVRLSRCVQHFDRKTDTPQMVIYSPGVRSGRGNTAFGRKLDRVFGGSLGWGLLDIIEETYRNLVFAYEQGDEVYIFGFSRGAFAARSLAGMIRSCGIAPRSHLGRIPEAVARYVSRAPETKPDHPQSFAFRADFAPDTATSQAEYNWRRKVGDTNAILLTLPYLGVWDTVSALGLPAFVPFADKFNAQYKFHDTNLSSSVLSARHAVALDERRKTFPAHLWSNLEVLNRRYDTDAGPQASPAYLQQWFAGTHGSVGGGGARIGLSSIAMHWVAMGAEDAGLALNWEDFDRQAHRLNYKAPTDNRFGPVGLSGMLLGALSKDRKGPIHKDDLSLAALDRFHNDSSYRPQSLQGVLHEIYGLDETAWKELRAQMITRDRGATHDLDTTLRPRSRRV